MEQNKEKKITHGEDFVNALFKLNGDELCALSKFLGVRLLTDDVDPETHKAIPREGADIIDDIIVHYSELGRMDRRWLLKYLQKTIKGR